MAIPRLRQHQAEPLNTDLVPCFQDQCPASCDARQASQLPAELLANPTALHHACANKEPKLPLIAERRIGKLIMPGAMRENGNLVILSR